MVIGPFGTKSQVAGVFLFWMEHRKVQVIYSFPATYTRSYLKRQPGATLVLPAAPQLLSYLLKPGTTGNLGLSEKFTRILLFPARASNLIFHISSDMSFGGLFGFIPAIPANRFCMMSGILMVNIFAAPAYRPDESHLPADFPKMQFGRPAPRGSDTFKTACTAGAVPGASIIDITGIEITANSS